MTGRMAAVRAGGTTANVSSTNSTTRKSRKSTASRDRSACFRLAGQEQHPRYARPIPWMILRSEVMSSSTRATWQQYRRCQCLSATADVVGGCYPQHPQQSHGTESWEVAQARSAQAWCSRRIQQTEAWPPHTKYRLAHVKCRLVAEWERQGTEGDRDAGPRETKW